MIPAKVPLLIEANCSGVGLVIKNATAMPASEMTVPVRTVQVTEESLIIHA